jgi:hypothetical protein
MSLIDKVTRLEKRIGQLAARSDVTPQPLEIRQGILDAVEERVQPGARGRRVFPFNRVTVDVLSADAAERASIDAVLEGEEGLREAVVDRLREAGCTKVEALRLRLRFAKKRTGDWPGTSVFRVTCQAEDEPAATVPAEEPQAVVRLAQVIVVKGTAARRSFPLSADTVNIGRQAEVLDKERRVVRRNQVVFASDADPANESVSRAHAHITRSAKGEFRLFDDHSSYGTRIFRAGKTIELPSGSPRGTRLQDGDEVYVGRACLRFELK